MNVLLVGAGRVGRSIAERLCAENHNVVIVDTLEEHLARARQYLDALTVLGQGSCAATLEKANVHKADLFIAVTDVDEVNLVACQLARYYGIPKRIARIGRPGLLPSDGGLKAEDMGADLLINPGEVCAQECARLIRTAAVSDLQEFAEGRVVMVALPAASREHPMVGRTLLSFREEPLMQRVRLVAIARGGNTLIPRGGTQVEKAADLYFMCPRESLDGLFDFLRIEQRKPDRVIVVGGGDVGMGTAALLEEAGIKVSVLEEQERRAEQISEELGRTLVFRGDASDLNSLKNVGVEGVDGFVATCPEDEVNILSCLMAKQLGARRTIAVIRKPEYLPLLSSLDLLDVAVSPRLVTANAIMRFIRKGKVYSVVLARDIDAEVIEMEVPAGSRVDGREIKDVKFPTDAIIGSIVRGSEVLPAPGSERLLAGDRVVVLARPKAIHDVENLFAQKGRR